MPRDNPRLLEALSFEKTNDSIACTAMNDKAFLIEQPTVPALVPAFPVKFLRPLIGPSTLFLRR